MKLSVSKSCLRGRVAIPGSKSHTIRCVAIASLAEGESEILSPLDSLDTRSAMETYRALGAKIDCEPGVWKVKGTGGRLSAPAGVADVGNSGTTLRFAIGSAALLQEGQAEFTGDEQIRSRPVGPLLKSLNDLGATCVSKLGNGKAPITVRGCLNGGKTAIEAVSSQYLSSLLINTPLAKGDTEIDVLLLNEKPYAEITLRYLEEQGITYERKGWEWFRISGRQGYKGFHKRVPADFSSATFFLCAGAILEGQLILEGLDFTDAQGDKAVVEVLRAMGADIVMKGGELAVQRKSLKGMEVDMNAIPDALPALAVTACFAEGETRLVNVAQARLKETDRIAVMARELGKLGADIRELPDGLVIQHSKLKTAEVSGHHDHRIVMALSLAGMSMEGHTVIDTAEAMSVTFPEYVSLMKNVGANMVLEA